MLSALFRKKSEEIERGPLYKDVKDAMADVQAYARSHGGQIVLVDVTNEGDVKIKLKGTCKGCPMASITLKYGVEMQLKRLVPAVKRIIQV